jgi:hypothetical protein
LGAIASAAEPEPVVQQRVVYQTVPAQQPVVVERTVVRRPCCLW